MPAAKDIIGNRYGRLVAVEWTGKSGNGGRVWKCVCDCGNYVNVGISQLGSGNTKSCGCLNIDSIIKRNTKHSLSKTKEYMCWKDAKKRCFNKNNSRYEEYLANGITFCDEWKDDFEAFLAHIGKMPQDGKRYTLGRIDNRKNYEPNNVEWQTLDIQARAHSLQKNNTSGVVGVHERKTTIGGRDYYEYRASVSLFKKKRTKGFSWNKYGKEQAFILACEWREAEIARLASEGVIYHESHGKRKGEKVND